MTPNPLSASLRLGSAFSLAVAALVTLTSTPAAHAAGSNPRVSGTYAVVVTVRDCATGAPAGPPFDSLVTLHAGGTITETPGGRAFAPGQRGSTSAKSKPASTWRHRRWRFICEAWLAQALSRRKR